MSIVPRHFIPQKATYTLQEAADYLHVTTRTIRRWIARGLLRRSHASRRILIPGEDVETFLARTS